MMLWYFIGLPVSDMVIDADFLVNSSILARMLLLICLWKSLNIEGNQAPCSFNTSLLFVVYV